LEAQSYIYAAIVCSIGKLVLAESQCGFSMRKVLVQLQLCHLWVHNYTVEKTRCFGLCNYPNLWSMYRCNFFTFDIYMYTYKGIGNCTISSTVANRIITRLYVWTR